MRALALLLPLLLAGPARALDEQAALRLLAISGQGYGCALVTPWGAPAEGLSIAAARADDDNIRVALVGERGGAPAVVAGPVDVEVIRMDPLLGSCIIRLESRPALGGRPVIVLDVHNSGLTTGRSSSTSALHFIVRDGDRLTTVFRSLVEARHSEDVGRRRRLGWSYAFRVVPGPATAGRMPDLVVQDIRTGRTVLRARWRGDRYEPPLFERFGRVHG